MNCTTVNSNPSYKIKIRQNKKAGKLFHVKQSPGFFFCHFSMCQSRRKTPQKIESTAGGTDNSAAALSMLLRNKKTPRKRSPQKLTSTPVAPSKRMAAVRLLTAQNSPGEGVLLLPSMSACENRHYGIQYHTWAVCTNRLGAEVPNHLSLTRKHCGRRLSGPI